MSERFDDMIRKQLEGLESPVPQDVFDKIRNHPDVSDAMFDGAIKNTLQPLESPVATGLFNKINAGADLTNAPFDEAIHQKLTSLESVVPADMWERIMERKCRRRPVAWWWVAAGLLLMIGGATLYATHQPGNGKAVAGNDMVSNKKIALANEPASQGNISLSHKTNSPVFSDISFITATPLQKQPKTDKEILSDNPISDNDKNLNTNNKTQWQKLKMKEKLTIIHNDDNQNKTNRFYQPEKNRTKILNTEDEAMVDVKSGLTKEEAETESFTSTLNTVQLAIIQQLRIATRLLPGQLLKAKPRLPVIPCPVNKDDGHQNWYADIYTSGFMFNKNVSDKEAGKNAGKAFDSTLHRQVSYNAGINLVKNLGSHILLKTGIQYNRLNESFRLTRINERKLVTTISVRIVIIAPRDTVYIRDTSVVEKIGTIQRRRQNTYQQWDVPIIIGYEFGGENIRLNANAGIIANIRSSYSGDLLDTLQQVISAKDYNGKPVYKTNVGLSLYAGLSIIKPLGEKTSLLIEPYARMGLNNTTTDNAWFRQKNSAAGISVGLRYQLNGSRQRR